MDLENWHMIIFCEAKFVPDQTKYVGRLIEQIIYRKLERVQRADIVSFDLHLLKNSTGSKFYWNYWWPICVRTCWPKISLSCKHPYHLWLDHTWSNLCKYPQFSNHALMWNLDPTKNCQLPFTLFYHTPRNNGFKFHWKRKY